MYTPDSPWRKPPGLPQAPLGGPLHDPLNALPSDEDAEKGVLSCFLNQPMLLAEAQASLPEVYFHHPANRLLYSVLLKMWSEGRPVENLSLTSYLREAGLLGKVGGPGVLSELLNSLHTPVHYGYYKGILRDKLHLRTILQACTETAACVREPHESVDQFYAEVQARFASLIPASKETTDSRRVLSITDLLHHQPDPEENLLGNGWLRRGGAALFVGPSGIGKSSASMQQDICWALGREAFGIEPARPLRILTVQSENDMDDLHEMTTGVVAHLGLTEAEQQELTQNTRYESWVAERGEAFLHKLRATVREFRPDLIRIDPFQGFAGCKIEDSEQVGNFLRAGLNPILQEHRCGLILAHHTPKPRQDVRKERTAMDFAYAGAGGAEITNWARAIIAIEVKGDGVFAFHAAKRGRRIGWENVLGFHETTRYYRHARDLDAMHWEEITDEREKENLASRTRGEPDAEVALLQHIPEAAPIERSLLIEKVNTTTGIGRNRLSTILRGMMTAPCPKVFPWYIKRPGTNPMSCVWTRVQEG